MNANQIAYEYEEDGVWILITLDEGYVLRVRVQDVAEELYDRTKSAIGPMLRERDEAHETNAILGDVLTELQTLNTGYDISDPKHPRYHSTHADIWDAREGK